MKTDFETWLERTLPTGTCPNLTYRELELMEAAFDAAWDIQRRTKLIPTELCQEVRRAGTYFSNAAGGLCKVKTRKMRSGGGRCRQCGHRLRKGESVLQFNYSMLAYRPAGFPYVPQSTVFVHAHDCGRPDEAHERSGD